MPRKPLQPLKKRRRYDLGLVIGAIIALAIATGVGLYVFWQTRTAPQQDWATLAEVIPATVQVVVSYNTDMTAWQKLGQFGTPPAQQIVAQGIAQSPLSLLLKQGKLDFSQDVQPWIGDQVITALLPDATLILATTRNPQASQTFLEKYRTALSQQGAIFTEKSENGLLYHISPTATANVNVVTAQIDNKFVAIATNESALQAVWNTYQKTQPALAQAEVFQSSLRSATAISEPLLQAYLAGNALGLAGPQLAVVQQKITGITMRAGIQREGLRWEIDTHLQDPRENIQTTSNQILQALPDSTFLFISGQNLAQWWQSLTSQAKGNSSAEAFVKELQQNLQDLTGWDIDRDLLPWLTGEFAIALVSSNQGILSNTGFGLAILLQTSDANATKIALEKLDNTVKSARGGLFPTGLEIKPTATGVNWQVGNTVIASRAVTAQGYALWTTGELDQLFLPSPTRPLPDSPSFQLLTTGLAGNNGGYFYVHITTALGIMDKLLPREVKANPTYTQVRTVLEAIEGIAVTSSVLDVDTARLELLLTLKPIPARQ
ncbi:MAG: DUF3352 domain-containing protein [Pseudanabaenaceae cyanobacterium]